VCDLLIFNFKEEEGVEKEEKEEEIYEQGNDKWPNEEFFLDKRRL
jgi:hypothetical protein